MDRSDSNGAGNGWNATEADAIAFRAAMRDDPAVPLTKSSFPNDEGGPVSVGRIELGYPFEDADVLADLFLDDFPTVAKIGPGGVVRDAVAREASPASAEKSPINPVPFAHAVATTAPTIEAKPTKPMVEALLVGHLPVLGSAWVAQYAKHIAQKTGDAVGLIRLSGGEATIDLALPPSVVPPQAGPMPSIANAMNFISAKTHRWIIRIDDAADRTSASEMARGIHASDRVTVLTGADEAAVVGCYRVIKTLEAGESTPAVHVAVMGTEGDRADEAAAKLSRAAEKFLGTKVTSEGCSARLTPGSAVNVYRGRPNLNHAELIDLLRSGPKFDAAATDEIVPEIASGDQIIDALLTAPFEEPLFSGPVVADPARPIARTDQRKASMLPPKLVADIQASEELPSAPPAPETLSAPPVVHPSTPVPTLPEPGRRPLASPAQPSSKPHSLARHLGSLEPLATVCPYAPEVELAIDPDGKLHLIASAKNDPGTTLTSLTTVRAWAEAHASLITMAHPRMTATNAICHLLTDSPKSVRRLGDSDLRLHLLTAPPGTREEDAGWVCVELN